ncbi:unnamed protein product [Oikopleura dioica]|uniref:CW-type domain-containing protein n=1 Tax=Oikopleura dioica TaxID=34765 RepID=E4XDM8_OIKDI|nr:unnamed protein product [Oikopleura dioica]
MELIPRARLTTAFLESNASTHESVFGAIAEIVDNAYDSGSPKLDIELKSVDEHENLQGKSYISFRDVGCGMTSKEMFNVIAYGFSNKNDNPEMIGMYGNGLKSGSMRVGNDCLVFSVKNDEMSVLMISQTFIKSSHAGYENLNNEVICPLPSWKVIADKVNGSVTYKPIYDKTKDEKQEEMRHKTEVELITSYSPFCSEEQLLEQFYGLESHGTIIILFQLNLNERGEPELTGDLDELDIHDVGDQANTANSLRNYLSTLYLKPRMQLHLRQEIIKPVRINDLMYERRKYNLPKSKFRSTAKAKIADLKEKKKKISNKIKKVKSEIGELNKDGQSDAGKIHRIRKLNMNIEKYETDLRRFDVEIKSKEKYSNVTEFELTLGYNIRDRRKSGLRIFSKNRLIVEMDGPSMAKWPLGVLAAVDVPAALMQPSMSKQRFADEREFRTLVKLCQERAHDYFKRIKIEFHQWCVFGYPNSDPLCEREENSTTNRAVDKALPPFFRCTREDCGKFRKLVDPEDCNPSYFICMDIKDPKYNSCKQAEEIITTKSLEVLPNIKTEIRDVEEVAVSPERKRPSKQAKVNGSSKSGPSVVRDAPIQNRSRIISDSEDDEPVIRKRHLRKRRSGHAASGAEVTSGFDRHRNVISDSSDEHSDPGSASSPPQKRQQRDHSGEELRKMEEQLEEMRLKIEKEKAERDASAKSLRTSMKTFYPTSWKTMKGRDHKHIDSWNLAKLQQMEADWHRDYTNDLISTMNKGKERAAKKSRATGRQELLREIDSIVRKIEVPQELKAKIKELEKTVDQEIANYKK